MYHHNFITLKDTTSILCKSRYGTPLISALKKLEAAHGATPSDFSKISRIPVIGKWLDQQLKEWLKTHPDTEMREQEILRLQEIYCLAGETRSDAPEKPLPCPAYDQEVLSEVVQKSEGKMADVVESFRGSGMAVSDSDYVMPMMGNGSIVQQVVRRSVVIS